MNLRIQTRIILPFLCLLLLSQGLVAWLGVRAVSREVETQISDRLTNIATMMSRSRFPLNAASLELVKAVIGYDVAVVSRSGRIRASSLGPQVLAHFQQWLRLPPPERSKIRDFYLVDLAGETFWGAEAEIAPRPGQEEPTTLFLLHASKRVSSAKFRAARPIAGVVLASVVVLAVLGLLIARTIASPIRRLAEQARGIGESGVERQLEVHGQAEVRELAEAFNRMLASLQESHARLVQSEKLSTLGHLAASVAHEIRNPLSSLRMTAQLLERRLPDDEKMQEPVRVIKEEIDRLDLALAEILSFARPREPEIAPVQIRDVLDSVLQLMSRQLEHSHLEVHVEIPDSVPEVAGDADQLKQVFVNLILNAMQAMPGGGELRLKVLIGDGERVRVGVRDTGEGIPEEQQDRVFQPFFSTREGGAGLGLALCKRIVEHHHGRIDFETSPDGTCFWIELPSGHDEARSE